MAVALNKTRIRDTKFVLVFALLAVVLTKPLAPMEGERHLHEIFDMAGAVLVGMCALGRLYCTAFLGGHKNQSLITYGPFSVSRNPLYFCSFLGACGIGLMTNHLTFILLLPATFCYVYFAMIAREEGFLREEFGADYARYCETTPRFFPNFAGYAVPETVTMYPKYIHKGLKDCLMWLAVMPLLELIEQLQMHGTLPTYFILP